MNSQELIQDEVMGVVNRIEDEGARGLDPLEVKVEAGIDGEIREIIAVLTTGGPHIEVALYAGRVDGWWGGDEHSAPILDDTADQKLTDLGDHYRHHWEDNVIA